jgi:hypothetical protein
VLLPRENERDIEEIPQAVRRKMEFVLIGHANDALPHVLTRLPKKRRSDGSGDSATGTGAKKKTRSDGAAASASSQMRPPISGSGTTP